MYQVAYRCKRRTPLDTNSMFDVLGYGCDCVDETLRLEVRPAVERLAHLNRDVDALENVLHYEQTDRKAEPELLVDLLTTGWRDIETPLDRTERKLEWMERSAPEHTGLRSVILDDDPGTAHK